MSLVIQKGLNNIFSAVQKGLVFLLIGLVKLYQAVLSPYLGKQCRYHPTCSHYMINALQEWGPFKGYWLGLRRIGRCHPWGDSGYDPVPQNPKRSFTKQKGEERESNL